MAPSCLITPTFLPSTTSNESVQSLWFLKSSADTYFLSLLVLVTANIPPLSLPNLIISFSSGTSNPAFFRCFDVIPHGIRRRKIMTRGMNEELIQWVNIRYKYSRLPFIATTDRWHVIRRTSMQVNICSEIAEYDVTYPYACTTKRHCRTSGGSEIPAWARYYHHTATIRFFAVCVLLLLFYYSAAFRLRNVLSTSFDWFIESHINRRSQKYYPWSETREKQQLCPPSSIIIVKLKESRQK